MLSQEGERNSMELGVIENSADLTHVALIGPLDMAGVKKYRSNSSFAQQPVENIRPSIWRGLMC